MAFNLDDFDHIRALVRRLRVGMLTTADARGRLRSRPLETLDFDDAGRLWFFVGQHSPKVDELERLSGQVNLSYGDTSEYLFVSISGYATVSQDRRQIERLWTPAARAFFPQGEDDPELAVLCVAGENAEFWDAPGSGVVRLIELTRRIAGGDADPGSALGENRKVDLIPS
jgi:general stress protein 26